MVVPLIAERVWQCQEQNRMMAKADKEVRVFYPSMADNTNWEYFKPPPSKNSNEDWEDVI